MAAVVLCLSLVAFSTYAQSTSSGPPPAQSVTITTDGTCGPGVGITCLGNPNGGQCCSMSGFCGSNDTYCATDNCQPGYGICGPFTSTSIPLSSGTISDSSPSGAGTVSPDGSCGGVNGYSCIGYSAGECCSNLGYCGSGPQYCMAGCQSAFGNCLSTNSSMSSWSNPSGMPSNSMNGSWTATATVTECDVCEGMTTSTGSKIGPTKSTTFPSPYTGAAVPGRKFDVGALALGIVGLFGFL